MPRPYAVEQHADQRHAQRQQQDEVVVVAVGQQAGRERGGWTLLPEPTGTEPSQVLVRTNNRHGFPHAFCLDGGGNSGGSATINNDIVLLDLYSCFFPGTASNQKKGNYNQKAFEWIEKHAHERHLKPFHKCMAEKRAAFKSLTTARISQGYKLLTTFYY